MSTTMKLSRPPKLYPAPDYIDNRVSFLDAIKYIDHHFGEGYASKNPDMIGAFMQRALLDGARWTGADPVRELRMAFPRAESPKKND